MDNLLTDFIKLAFFATGISFGLIAYMRYKQNQGLKAQGLSALQAIRLLITQIQRHRGLTIAVRADRTEFEHQITETETKVSYQLHQIANLSPVLGEKSEWEAITQHWARLAGNCRKLPPEVNIEQHSRLIGNLLVFIDELCVVHQLTGSTHNNLAKWRELLMLSEYIGQARALGTWVSIAQSDTTTHSPGSADEKLIRLNNQILETLESPQSKKIMDSFTVQLVVDYLIYVDKHVLMEDPAISSTEFFNKSTEILSQLFECMDEEIYQEHQKVNGDGRLTTSHNYQ